MGNKIWTKDNIIINILTFYKKNNRCPKATEFRNKNNLPSYTYTLKILNVNTIDEICKKCNIPKNKYTDKKRISESLVRSEINRIYSIINRVPTKHEFNDMASFNSIVLYRRFGSIYSAFESYGLVEMTISKEDKIKNNLADLIALSDKLNRAPKVFEYEAILHFDKHINRRLLENKLGLSYGEIVCKYTNYYPAQIKKDSILPNKLDIKNALFKLSCKLGRAPFGSELKDSGFSTSTIYKVFDTNSILNIYNEIEMPYGSRTTTISKSDDLLLNEFSDLYKKLGHIPHIREFDRCISSSATYINRFGSINNVCDILGIKIDTKNRYVGKILFDKNGDICKSNPEMKITNFLIDNNISYEKENSYSEIFNDDNRRFDWKLRVNNRVYYMEYFGIYNPKRSNSFIVGYYNKKTKKKIRDLYKSNVVDRCIFLFPYDFKTEKYKKIILNLKEN